MKRTGLGRGLDALIDTSHVDTNGSSSISEVELSRIIANPNQPRRNFDEEALEELAGSIKEHGVISPITLRKNDDDTYMIIAGERRYRASKMAGLNTIPAYVRTAKDEQVMEWALIENIQRDDLDAIEIALAYQRLMDDYGLTQEKMSERVGKKRATVANYLRLLKLPAEIQMGLQQKRIDMGHARAILGSPSAEEQLKLFKRILQEGLSVRKVEQLVQDGADRAKNNNTKQNEERRKKISKVEREAESKFSSLFGVKAKVSVGTDGKGKITIPFKDKNELAAILSKL